MDFIDEKQINSFITPENKLNRKELAELITKVYDQIKVNQEKDKNQTRPASHDADEKNNQLSPTEEEEAALGKELKQICDEYGKEIYPKQSALILHKLAQIYRERSPDKLSLIKSAALFNAALIRSPIKNEIEENLHRLCRHILKQAGAKISDADLVEKANEIKKRVVEMRNSVKEKLTSIKQGADHSGEEISMEDKNIERIFSIKLIQDKIYSNYISLMDEISRFCTHVMGEPPCKFSVVGMGSLARKEISPFSDFEHMILLEEINDQNPSYDDDIEYFRWFSTIFHVIVINLQETILPSIDIICLRKTLLKPGDNYWFYDHIMTRGISFDGFLPWANKNPLGRQEFTEKKQFKTELIKPVSKMLQYLSSEEDLKQGYHLADLLTKVCFVHGNKKLFEIFENKMNELLETDNTDTIVRKLEGQLKEDFQNFAVRSIMLKLRSNEPINIKKVVYRSTTLFISALGRIHKIRANSCFEIIERLFMKEIITENAKYKLEYAIALACEVRLRWYMKCGRQTDVIQGQTDQGSTIKTFTSLLGLENTISYFQIAYSLQCDFSKRFNLKKIHFHSNPRLLNHKIIFGLNCENETVMKVTSQKSNAYNQRFLDFDECLTQLEQNIEIRKEAKEKVNKNFYDVKLQNAETYIEIGNSCRRQCRWDDAIELYEMCICEIKELSRDEKSIQINKMHRHCLYWIGYCLQQSYKFKDAINQCRESIFVCKNILQDNDCYLDIARSFHRIGKNFEFLRRPNEAIKYYEQSLLIYQSISINNDYHEGASRVLQDLVVCYADMNQNEAGKEYYYERWMQSEKQKSSKIESQNNDDDCDWHNKGETLYRLNKFNEALENFNKILEIKKRVSTDEQTDSDIGESFYWIGRCLYDLNKHTEALENFKNCLEIRERVSTDKQTDSDISHSLYCIGQCLYGLNKYDEALESFQKCLEIRERVSTDKQTDNDVSDSLYWIGGCLYGLNKYDKALESFRESFEIQERVSIETQTDRNKSSSLFWIGGCLFHLNIYDEALESFKKYLEITERVSNDNRMNNDISLFLWIGRCLYGLKKYDEALESFKECLQISEQVSIEKQMDGDISHLFYWIGCCLYNLTKYDDALENFKKHLKVKERVSINKQTDSDISDSLYWIGGCLFSLNKYDEALESFKKVLEIRERVSTDIQTDSDISNVYSWIGQCCYGLNIYDEALESFKKCLEIRERVSINKESDSDLSHFRYWIGLCFFGLNKHYEEQDSFTGV